MVRIKTIHDRCQGLFDEQQQEVDGDLVCRKSTARPAIICCSSPRSLLESINLGFTA
jgi:hypothetical protein